MGVKRRVDDWPTTMGLVSGGGWLVGTRGETKSTRDRPGSGWNGSLNI